MLLQLLSLLLQSSLPLLFHMMPLLDFQPLLHCQALW